MSFTVYKCNQNKVEVLITNRLDHMPAFYVEVSVPYSFASSKEYLVAKIYIKNESELI